jgi:hypothetical protein
MRFISPFFRVSAREISASSRKLPLRSADSRLLWTSAPSQKSPTAFQPRQGDQSPLSAPPTSSAQLNDVIQDPNVANPPVSNPISFRIHPVKRPAHLVQPPQVESEPPGDDAPSEDDVRSPPIFMPILFLGLSGSIFYLSAAWYSNHENARMVEKISKGGIFGNFSSFIGRGEGSASERWNNYRNRVSEPQLQAAHKQDIAERLGTRLNSIIGFCDSVGLPAGAKTFVAKMYCWGSDR